MKGKERVISNIKFVNLHSHTVMSVFDGLGYTPEHYDFCYSNGMDAMAITNHGNMNSVPHQVLHAKKMKSEGKKFKPIFGVEAYFVESIDDWKDIYEEHKKKVKTKKKDAEISLVVEDEELSKKKTKLAINKRAHLVVLAQNEIGLKNLFKLVSLSYQKENFYRYPRIDFKMLAKYNEGLIVSSACMGGPLSKCYWEHWEKGDKIVLSKMITLINKFKLIFEDRFFCELQWNGYKEQHLINKLVIEAASKTDTKLISTADSHYPGPELWKQREVYKALGWLGKNTSDELLDKISIERTDLKCELYPKNGAQMWESYKSYSEKLGFKYDDDLVMESIERTHFVAHEMIEDFGLNTEVKLPSFILEEGIDPDARLKELCYKGLVSINKADNKEYIDRLEEEMSIISDRGFSRYFLTMIAVIDKAKNSQLIGPARGSAGGSLVAYLTEITQVDPIKYDLLFSRFLRKDAKDYPDIDVDFSYNMQLKEELIRDWGKEKVVPITNFSTLKLRSLIKDLSKLYGIPFTEVNKVTSTMEKEAIPGAKKSRGMKAGAIVPTFDELMTFSPSLRKFLKKYSEIKQHIKVLHGQIRSISRHAGGVIIADDLESCMPLISSKGVTQSPWSEGQNVRHLEPFGFIKFDLLALDTLKMFDACIRNILKSRGVSDPTFQQVSDWYNENLHPDKIDLHDQKVYEDIFHKGTWAGIFQFTEAGAQDFCKRIKPKNITDLAIVTSIYRPGPLSSNVDRAYLDAISDPGSIHYINDEYKEATEKTSGFLVFQEQIAVLAHKLGKNISLDDGNLIRKLFTKKGDVEKKALEEDLKDRFVVGCKEKGISTSDARAIWRKFEFFAGYGFNKSHAVAYSIISYQCAWLFKYFPVEWAAAFLDKEPESRKEKSINIVRSLGFNVEQADINYSDFAWGIKGQRTLVQPLSSIKGVGDKAIEQIVSNRPFNTIEELIFNKNIVYSKLNKRVLDALIRAEAMNSLLDERFTGLKHFWSAVALDRPKTKKKFLENIEIFAAEESFSTDETIQNIASLTGFYPISLVMDKKTKDKLEDMGVPPVGNYDKALQLSWVIVREIIEKVTSKGNPYWIVKVTDETNKTTEIKCWGVDPLKDVLKINGLYLTQLDFNDTWGFSSRSLKRQWKLLK